MRQGRGQVQEVQLGATRQGRLGGAARPGGGRRGRYPGQGAFLPFLTGQMLSGVYDIPRIDYEARAYATNTTPPAPTAAPAGPRAAALVERAMDLLAMELGLDPAELRRRNLVPPDAFPHETAAGATYDSGDYGAALDRALELAGYQELRRRAAPPP